MLSGIKKKAIINSSAGTSTVSSEVLTKCSEIDGEYNCERNQFSLFQLNADIESYKITNKNHDKYLELNFKFSLIDQIGFYKSKNWRFLTYT